MVSEKELCVDELLRITSRVDELSQILSTANNSELISESRAMLESTQLYIDNNKPLIPSYILKKAIDSLKRLEKQVDAANKTSVTFKFNSKPSGSRPSIEKKLSSNSGPVMNSVESTSGKDFCGFRSRTKEDLQIAPEEIESKDVSLVDLLDCSVKVIGLANTLYIRNLQRTTVTVCLACRAITITNCSDCTFKFVCQQLRIDSTVNCSFTIFTSARSMLESSKQLTFKMLNLDELASDESIGHERLMEYIKRANFNEHQNNWKCIDDFDWLSPTSPSVNYKVIE
jgi:hypothetical protein